MCQLLLNIAYNVLSSLWCERLKPSVNNLIEPHHDQCGYRSTINQIFTRSKILENTREKRIDTHQLFVSFKSAFEERKGAASMPEFGIST